MEWRLHTCAKRSSSFPLMTLSAELKEPPPDHGPGLGVLAGGVDDGHQGHPADVADVIVDEELEVGEVDQGEVAIVQVVMGVVLLVFRNILQNLHQMFSVHVTLNVWLLSMWAENR